MKNREPSTGSRSDVALDHAIVLDLNWLLPVARALALMQLL